MKNPYFHKAPALLLLLCAAACLTLSCAEDSSSVPNGQTEAGTETATESSTAVSLSGEETLDPPLFSAESGFYDAPFSLTISAADGAAIYYTTDGSLPTAESPRYAGPLEISDPSSAPDSLSTRTDIAPAGIGYVPPDTPVDKAAVIRAVAVMPDGSHSPVVSRTYFVDFSRKAAYYRQMKTVSVVTDAQNLFDSDTGIYVLGKTHSDWIGGDDYSAAVPPWFMPANYTQHGRAWEREAFVQIFENGQMIAAQNAGIRIHGGATRSYPQKSLNLYARAAYGAPKLNCDLFSGKVLSEYSGEPVTVFDTVILRNGGNDAMYTRFRDKLNQSLSAGRAFLTQGMEPCTVFLNGEFWGQYEITEKADAAFVKAHCGVPKKDVCIVKKEELDEGSEETYAEWQQLREQIRKADYTDPSAYAELCEAVDMQSFADYVSCEIYMANANWGSSNAAMWKASVTDEGNPYADGKWRFIMFDTEYSTGIYGEVLPSDDSFSRLLERDCFLADLLRAALKNDSFREQFDRSFREIAEQCFRPEKVSAAIDALEASYRDAAADTCLRFRNSRTDRAEAEESFTAAVRSVREFYAERPQYIMAYLEQLTG